MKLLSTASCVCLLSLALTGCQSVALPDIQKRLSGIDFNFDSTSYVVRAGESLETIAFRYDIPVSTLRQLNPQAANGVYTGMHLNIRHAGVHLRQAERNDRWADSPDREKVARTAPVEIRQAVPVATVATDQYLLGAERYNRALPESQHNSSISNQTGYVPQPGYPVEEVINDEDFVLPGSDGAMRNAVERRAAQSWQWPLSGQLARDYDPQRANGRGIEIVGLPGQQVYAARDGVVDWVARSPDGVGKVVIVRHADDYLSIYSNARDLFVSMKDSVRQGDPIASLGANVNDEPLLRFEISKDGNLLNPMDFLSTR